MRLPHGATTTLLANERFDGRTIPEDHHVPDLLWHAFVKRQNLNLAASLANDAAEEVRVQTIRYELSTPPIRSMDVHFNVPDRQETEPPCGGWLAPRRPDCVSQD